MANSHQDEFKRSTDNLKKAVPLMMKHQVATTPANYALWYTYVDNTTPQLNEEMDKLLNEHDTLPSRYNVQLYQDHIAHQEHADLEQMRSSLEALLSEAGTSIGNTLNDTTKFSNQIDKSFKQLEDVDLAERNLDEVMSVVRQFIDESKAFRQSTEFFRSQLQSARQEVEQLKQELADVQKEAQFDSLTGLMNRRELDRDIQRLIDAKSRFSLILLDIDHFKALNDTYGHLFGDGVLKALAKRLRSSCRDGTTAYRYGGEEFVLLQPNMSLRSASLFADTLRKAIEKMRVRERHSGKQMDTLTASFGVAQWQAGDDVETLVYRADQRLYEAKQLGRNRVMPL